MKVYKQPTNIYEAVVKKTSYVTYNIYALSSADAMKKAERGAILNDVEQTGSTTIDADVESIECKQRDIYNDEPRENS